MAVKPSLCRLTKQLFLRFVRVYNVFPPTFPCLSPSWIWKNHLPFQRGRLPVLSARVLCRGSQGGERVRLGRAGQARSLDLPDLRPDLTNTNIERGTKSWNNFNRDSAPRREGGRGAPPLPASRGLAASRPRSARSLRGLRGRREAGGLPGLGAAAGLQLPAAPARRPGRLVITLCLSPRPLPAARAVASPSRASLAPRGLVNIHEPRARGERRTTAGSFAPCLPASLPP